MELEVLSLLVICIAVLAGGWSLVLISDADSSNEDNPFE